MIFLTFLYLSHTKITSIRDNYTLIARLRIGNFHHKTHPSGVRVEESMYTGFGDALRPYPLASLAGIAKQHQGHYQNPYQLHAHGVELADDRLELG